MLTLAKGSLCAHPLPWWSRPPWRGSPSDSQGTQGGLLGTCQPTPGLLLPCTAGPCVRLWHRCYLRGLPQEQVRGKLRHGGGLGTGCGGLGGVPVWLGGRMEPVCVQLVSVCPWGWRDG